MSSDIIRNPNRGKSYDVAKHHKPYYQKEKVEPIKLVEDPIMAIKEKLAKNRNLYHDQESVNKILGTIPTVGSNQSWIHPDKEVKVELYTGQFKTDDVKVEEGNDSMKELIHYDDNHTDSFPDEQQEDFSLHDVKCQEYFIVYKETVIASGNSDVVKEQISDLYQEFGEDFNLDEVAVFKRIKPVVGIVFEE